GISEPVRIGRGAASVAGRTGQVQLRGAGGVGVGTFPRPRSTGNAARIRPPAVGAVSVARNRRAAAGNAVRPTGLRPWGAAGGVARTCRGVLEAPRTGPG